MIFETFTLHTFITMFISSDRLYFLEKQKPKAAVYDMHSLRSCFLQSDLSYWFLDIYYRSNNYKVPTSLIVCTIRYTNIILDSNATTTMEYFSVVVVIETEWSMKVMRSI